MKKELGRAMDVPLRSLRERVLQTLLFEAGGLLLVAPLVAWAGDVRAAESLVLLVALSAAVMAWAAIYNTAFDLVEAHVARRVASARPHLLRVLHALGLEVSSVLATCPIIVWLTGLGWWQALAVDIALGLVYAAYGYAYHWLFDRLRPVQG
ncbi:PACE efflux transporter [Variovorax sp. YR752]|uniref:PACE efflux transporter n=1 Tax=Variovorax sp. YR752 TaxID=1884383 RepID=UPI0031383B89